MDVSSSDVREAVDARPRPPKSGDKVLGVSVTGLEYFG